MHCIKYLFAGPPDTVHIGTSSRVVWRGAEKSLARPNLSRYVVWRGAEKALALTPFTFIFEI